MSQKRRSCTGDSSAAQADIDLGAGSGSFAGGDERPGTQVQRARAAPKTNYPTPHIFLTTCTMSSSCNSWSLPTRCGRCFADAPHTSAYLNCRSG